MFNSYSAGHVYQTHCMSDGHTLALLGSIIACLMRSKKCEMANCSWKVGPHRLTHASLTCMLTDKPDGEQHGTRCTCACTMHIAAAVDEI